MSTHQNSDSPRVRPPKREYERSGMYVKDGKSFRIVALLVWLAGAVVVMAGTAALLDYLLIY